MFELISSIIKKVYFIGLAWTPTQYAYKININHVKIKVILLEKLLHFKFFLNRWNRISNSCNSLGKFLLLLWRHVSLNYCWIVLNSYRQSFCLNRFCKVTDTNNAITYYFQISSMTSFHFKCAIIYENRLQNCCRQPIMVTKTKSILQNCSSWSNMVNDMQ